LLQKITITIVIRYVIERKYTNCYFAIYDDVFVSLLYYYIIILILKIIRTKLTNITAD